MTDAAPQEPVTLDEAVETMGAAVEQLLSVFGQQHDPREAAVLVLMPTIAALERWMHVESIRVALLTAFVSTHPAGLSFIDVKEAKEAIEIINRRQKAARGQATILLPTEH